MRPWSKEWFHDCCKWRGKVLDGEYRHWCFEWDELPVDETTPEFPCECFTCQCGAVLETKDYGPWGRNIWQIHDDIFICPNSHFWNFWKHKYLDLTNNL